MTQWLAQSYTGLMLCKPCWNNRHNHRETITNDQGVAKKTNRVIVDCEQMGCQCPCVQLLNEKHPRVKTRLLKPDGIPEREGGRSPD